MLGTFTLLVYFIEIRAWALIGGFRFHAWQSSLLFAFLVVSFAGGWVTGWNGVQWLIVGDRSYILSFRSRRSCRIPC